jgi:hypothetical protein
LSSREGFEFLSPSRRACTVVFSTFCGSETPIFHCSGGEEMETNGGHRGDRTLSRTRSRRNQTRPVSNSGSLARGLGFSTGASGHSRERRIWSGARETANVKGRSDIVTRPVTIDRSRGQQRESVATGRLGASDQFDRRVRSL